VDGKTARIIVVTRVYVVHAAAWAVVVVPVVYAVPVRAVIPVVVPVVRTIPVVPVVRAIPVVPMVPVMAVVHMRDHVGGRAPKLRVMAITMLCLGRCGGPSQDACGGCGEYDTFHDWLLY